MLLNDEWIIGFFEGEGSLTWGKWNCEREKNSYVRYQPVVNIAQKERRILEDIQRHLGFGHISSYKGYHRWNCGGFKECRKFVLFIQNRLKSETKQSQLERWLFVFPTLMNNTEGYGHSCKAEEIEPRIKEWKEKYVNGNETIPV